MRRVEDVLGKGWENHVEGQKLKADGDSFRMKLNTLDLFEEWARKVRFPGLSGRQLVCVFSVAFKRHFSSVSLSLLTNLDGYK
jgi:hypothetical protein